MNGPGASSNAPVLDETSRKVPTWLRVLAQSKERS